MLRPPFWVRHTLQKIDFKIRIILRHSVLDTESTLTIDTLPKTLESIGFDEKGIGGNSLEMLFTAIDFGLFGIS